MRYKIGFLKVKGINIHGANEDNYDIASAIQHELVNNGYVLDEIAFGVLVTETEEVLKDIYSQCKSMFAEYMGSDKYLPLYENFPIIPKLTNWEHRVNSWMALIGKDIVDSTVFEEEFSYHPKDLKVISLLSDEQFESIFTDMLYANSSLSSRDNEDIRWFINEEYSYNYSKIQFKETAALVGALSLDSGVLNVRSCTDILRIFSAYNGGDSGLKTNTKYTKPSVKVRSTLRKALNESKDIEESFKIHGEKWKRVLFYLQPGLFREEYPRLFKYADLLRNDKKSLKTFNSKVEKLISDKDERIFKLLSKRKGVFGRRLNHLIEVFGIRAWTEFSKFEHTPKRLFELYNYFEGRREESSRNTILASNEKSDLVSYGTQKAMEWDTIDSIQEHILRMIPKKLGKVFIDPKLYYRPLQANNRATSDSLSNLPKGTCQELPEGKFVRMYVQWKGRSDLDLSAMLYSSKTSKFDKVGWNSNHIKSGVTYSGDNQGQSAYNAEYIDIDPSLVDYEWVITDVVVYRGPNLNVQNVTAGWMVRDTTNQTIKWLPETVDNASKIESNSTRVWLQALHIPSRTIIHMDITTKGSNVTGNNDIEKVIGWLEKSLVIKTEEIQWSRLNQGHILHLLAHEVTTEIGKADTIFDENTTWDKVASLI